MKRYKIRSLVDHRINVYGKPLFNKEDVMIVIEKTQEIKNLEKNGYILVEEDGNKNSE